MRFDWPLDKRRLLDSRTHLLLSQVTSDDPYWTKEAINKWVGPLGAGPIVGLIANWTRFALGYKARLLFIK